MTLALASAFRLSHFERRSVPEIFGSTRCRAGAGSPHAGPRWAMHLLEIQSALGEIHRQFAA